MRDEKKNPIESRLFEIAFFFDLQVMHKALIVLRNRHRFSISFALQLVIMIQINIRLLLFVCHFESTSLLILIIINVLPVSLYINGGIYEYSVKSLDFEVVLKSRGYFQVFGEKNKKVVSVWKLWALTIFLFPHALRFAKLKSPWLKRKRGAGRSEKFQKKAFSTRLLKVQQKTHELIGWQANTAASVDVSF